MVPQVKIATCCYCSRRTVLELAGNTRHELCCAACGAPVTRLKALKREAVRDRPLTFAANMPKDQPRRIKRRPARKRSRFLHVLEEFFDEIEDIFD